VVALRGARDRADLLPDRRQSDNYAASGKISSDRENANLPSRDTHETGLIMAMTIYDFAGKHEASSVPELENVLQKRYGSGRNGFWISHGKEIHPCMSLLVNGELSTVLYLPEEDHPGFASVGRIDGLDRIGFTTFSYDTLKQEQEFINSQVIPFASALLAAKDFLAMKALPKSIEWDEL